MNILNSTAIAALLTAAIGLTAVAPAMAIDTTTTAPVAASTSTTLVADQNNPGPGHHHQGNGGQMGQGKGNGPMGQDDQNGPRGPGGMMGLFGFEAGAEAIDMAFVHISHAITLTDAQKPLLDDLHTTALTAQTTFADAVKAARPAADATTKPDLTTMVKARIAIETAHTQALTTILPKLEAFTASLTDEQKASLAPQHQHDDAAMGQRSGHHHMGNGPGDGMAPMAQPDGAAPPAAPGADAPPAPAVNG